jgi:rhodanese-related sulfurtransferase
VTTRAAKAAAPAARAPRGFPSIASALAAWPGVRLLDVREPEAFRRGHAAGAGHVPAGAFAERRMELPAREQPLLVLHDEAERAREVALALAARGYEGVGWLAAPLAGDRDGLASREPAARLWSPSPFLEREHARAPRGRALDLACGTGRATVFLAASGWDAEGWDVDDSALERARAFAARERVRARFARVDLELGPVPVRDAAYELVTVSRFLHRELYPWIERALAPGGVLFYETFRLGQERFGPPRRPRHLLGPGELLRAFPSLRVEWHEESATGTPPVMARLVARRPG